jgi:hypothetical protein
VHVDLSSDADRAAPVCLFGVRIIHADKFDSRWTHPDR